MTPGEFQTSKSIDRCADPYIGTVGGVVTTEDRGRLCSDVVISKLSADGSRLVYSTYLGGNFVDTGDALAVAPDGTLYVGGRSGSTNLPVSRDSPFLIGGGGKDGFLAKVDPNGTIQYITQTSARINAMALAPDGGLVVTGPAYTSRMPVTAGAFQSFNAGGVSDVYVAKLAEFETPTVADSRLFKVASSLGSVLINGKNVLYLMARATPRGEHAHSSTPTYSVTAPDGKVIARKELLFEADRGVRDLLGLGVTPVDSGAYSVEYRFDIDSLQRPFNSPQPSALALPHPTVASAPADGSLALQWNLVPGARGYWVEIYDIVPVDGKSSFQLVALGPPEEGSDTAATLPAGFLKTGHSYTSIVTALTFDPRDPGPLPDNFAGTANASDEFQRPPARIEVLTGADVTGPVSAPPGSDSQSAKGGR